MTDKPTVVDAHQFVLRGASGRKLAVLTSNEDEEAYLSFFDKEGMPRIALGFTKDEECRFVFLDHEGRQRLNLAFLPNGEVAIMAMGGAGKPAVGFQSGWDAGCGLVAIGGSGKVRGHFGIDGNGYPNAIILNPDGKVAWNAVRPEGTGMTKGGIVLPT